MWCIGLNKQNKKAWKQFAAGRNGKIKRKNGRFGAKNDRSGNVQFDFYLHNPHLLVCVHFQFWEVSNSKPSLE